MQMQQVQQAAQMQMQQQQQAQMMAEQQRQAQGIPGGEGFNPAMGGQSPINVNSTVQTRERVTGETRGGVPIGEGL
jgi:transcription initiation factor TFIID subunit TAF12